jgi:hypothetical protein
LKIRWKSYEKLQMGGALVKTLVITRRKFPANPGSHFINRTLHGLAVNGRTPAIGQLRHELHPRLISFDQMLGDAGLGNEHNLQPAAAGLTVGTGYLGVRQEWIFAGHKFLDLGFKFSMVQPSAPEEGKEQGENDADNKHRGDRDEDLAPLPLDADIPRQTAEPAQGAGDEVQ